MITRNAKRIKAGITVARFDEAMARYAGAEHREAEINKRIEEEVNELLEKYNDELMCLSHWECR